MICNFSNFQHGTHHGGCPCGVTAGITGTSDMMTVSPLILVIEPCKFQRL